VGQDANQFYKLENVSNTDSIVVSARSSRLDSARNNNIEGSLRGTGENHIQSMRQSIVSWRDQKIDAGSKIKIHNKQN